MTTKINKNKLVSVILPVYSYNIFIKDSLSSIINQSYFNIEIIIIDDSSDKRLLDLIKTFSDKRIIHVNGNKTGLSSALNLGINLSKGQYIARMDCDDLSDLMRIEKQLFFMIKKDIDICGTNALIINSRNNVTDTFIAPKNNNLIIPYLVSFIPFFHGSIMINKKFIEKYKLKYENNFAEDKFLWMKFFYNRAKFDNLDDFLYKYRQHEGSLFVKNQRKIKKELKLINKNFIKNNIELIMFQFTVNLNDYNNYSEKDKEILVDFYFKCFFYTFKLVFLKIFFVGRLRYLVIYLLKYITKSNT